MLNSANEDRCNRFVQLLTAHEHRLEACVLALVPNWSDAEDVIQQTKLRLWQEFAAYDPTKDFGTWACVIARYEVMSFCKRSARAHIMFSQELIERLSEDVAEAEAESSARLAIFERCLKKLGQWQQDLLARCYETRHCHSQKVASLLGRKPEAIRQMLTRLRRELHRCVEESEQREGKAS